MTDDSATVRASIDVALDSAAAFDTLVEQIASGLAQVGIRFDAGADGRLVEGEVEVGRVVAWTPGARVALEWRPAPWTADVVTMIDLRVEAIAGGSRITLEHPGWGRLLGEPDEQAGWFAREVVAPMLATMAPAAFGDWLTDRRARRPSGAQSRGFYRDPIYHYPSFRVILDELLLTPHDHLLEVGCGGGALLKLALRSGCLAAAVDHSPEMVELARKENAEAVAARRLVVHEAPADALPFNDGTFTCAAMAGVLGFLPEPVAVFAEIRRVLAPGGRFVGLGSNPKYRGTPAAPEPMASRLRFYEPAELEALARQAGFDDVQVVHRDLEAYAREAGVPEEHLPLFATGDQFLVARKR